MNGITISTISGKNMGSIDINTRSEKLPPLTLYDYDYHEVFKQNIKGTVYHTKEDGILSLIKNIITDVEIKSE